VLARGILRLHSRTHHVRGLWSVPSYLAGGLFGTSLLASNSSVETPLQPVKLSEGICKGGCDVDSRFAVQTLCMD